ncbi:MAG: MFS transporter [Chitinophagaceae bacterium]
MSRIYKHILSLPVIVAALGYFVDIYDLLLFSIVRVPSLQSLGVPQEQLLDKGIFLINIQMAGMLVGGILWGIIGDKKGRLSVLFGSIILYSIANILNTFVGSIGQYAVLRLIAGIGLAGELGAGITLVAEILPKKIRGFGTAVVASVGLLGAVLAYGISHWFNWKITYLAGGILGLILLVLRFNVFESGSFKKMKEEKVQRGNFLILFSSYKRFFKYLRCILIGIPIWFVIGILITFSPEFGKAAGITEAVDAGKAVMFCYIGLSLGDLSSGLISQWLKSRKKAVLLYSLFTVISSLCYLLQYASNIKVFYFLCFCMGFSIGYWALFVTIAAEQFGTNIRATVATTVPNFVRGSINIFTPLFLFWKIKYGVIVSAGIVGGGAIVIALLSLWRMEETFHKDLDYCEDI